MKPLDAPAALDVETLHAEQAAYAHHVEKLVWLGLMVIVLAFPAYVLGWLAPQWPLESLPGWWGLSARRVAELAPPSGWQGLVTLERPDFLSLAGIALLASAPALGLLGLVARYLQRGDRTYTVICLALVALLGVAAIGIPQPGR